MAEENIKGAYTQLSSDDKVLTTDAVTAAMWSGNNPTLKTFFSSSVQAASNVSQYYISVYQTASTEVSAEIQFDVAYCDIKGSGSEFLNNLVTGF